jgi:hypothetical protein
MKPIYFVVRRPKAFLLSPPQLGTAARDPLALLILPFLSRRAMRVHT